MPGAGPNPIGVRVIVPGAPDARVAVELCGDFGAARTLRMAGGVAGAYKPLAYHRHVHGLAAFADDGRPLAVDSRADGGWRLDGPGALARIIYEVDVASMARDLADLLVSPRRRGDHMVLVGYGLFAIVQGAEDRAYRVALTLPAGWRVAWALAREGGEYRADSLFELLDEPAMLGAGIETIALHPRPEDTAGALATARYVHVWSERGDPAAAARVAGQALRASRRAIAALGFPDHARPYHALFELLSPAPGQRLGWAMEHGRSLHAVDAVPAADAAPARGLLGAMSPRLCYHVIHHELHAYIPRRAFTDRLAPRRQAAGEPTGFIFFAEGFVQYLAFVGLARAGIADVDTVLARLAARFAAPYLAGPPPGAPSIHDHSLQLCAGDHTFWRWQFAAGGLLALWVDQQMRATGARGQQMRGQARGDGAAGMAEAMLAVFRAWDAGDAGDGGGAGGVPEAEFERAFARVTGFAIEEMFARHVRGDEPLPVDAILAGAGIVRQPDGFDVRPAAELSARVAGFRRAFGAP